MKNFLHSVIAELKTDDTLNTNSLVKMVVESTGKSILNNTDSKSVYSELKASLITINEHLKSSKIDALISQFNKTENTQDSKIKSISNLADLRSSLLSIKESTAYSNPLILEKVNRYFNQLDNTDQEYKMYPGFISDFKMHSVEESVETAVSKVKAILEENASDYELLYAISLMESANYTKMYSHIIPELKAMLAEGKYTADIINLKFGASGLPHVNTLVNNLKVVESKESDKFSLGNGNTDTVISDVIAPCESVDNGLVAYLDNRFIRISESTDLTGKETEIHFSEGHTIATVDPNWVKDTCPELYKVSEAFAVLGFNQVNSNIVESKSIRNFNIALSSNVDGKFDVLVNGSNVGDAKSVNLTEALAMEADETRKRVTCIFENISKIYSLGFIKNITNLRMMTEATIFDISKTYIVCDKKNQVERDWKKVDEKEMFDYFNEKFQYDISPIFGVQINESIEASMKIEESKKLIQADINKLESSISKLDEAIKSDNVGAQDTAKLEDIKGSIEKSISELKEKYIELDLTKKSVNENKSEKDEYCQKHFNCDYDECTDKQKEQCDKACGK